MKFKSIYLTPQWLWAILAFFSITAASAQTVKGHITDVKNEPLIGASIVVEGTTKGAITNENGDYSLDVTGF
jgi:hypothetical protein